MSDKKLLHLNLFKIFFDQIAAGVKKEEYRIKKGYWEKRLSGKSFDLVHFRNGYSKNSRTMIVECLGIENGMWNGKRCFVIKLGEIKGKNVRKK